VVCLRPDGFGRVLCLLCSLLDCGRDYGLFDPVNHAALMINEPFFNFFFLKQPFIL
jgi:hypothetical protein